MKYYYATAQNQQRGPVSLEELKELLSRGIIHGHTPVWKEGMMAWKPLNLRFPHLVAPMPPPSVPPSHLGFAITTTILCCMPIGVIAIFEAAKVEGLHAGGQYEEAKAASRRAAAICWWNLGICLAFLLFGLYMLMRPFQSLAHGY